MDEETMVAQGLHTTGDSAGYDAACKRVLSEKAILARIMQACLAEYRNCPVRDIEDKSVHEGTVTYDIRFRAIAPNSGELIGLIVNVEAQNDFYPGYPLTKRGIYYCCRMISSQYGREFTGSHYEKLKKVYSIWICMNPPRRRENTITWYRLTEEHLVGKALEPVQNYDLLSIVMLCLGGPDSENYDSVLRMLDVLLSHETSEAEKRRILQDEYDIQMTRTLESEVSVMCNLSKGVMEKSWKKGVAEGKEKGILSSIESLKETMNWTLDQAITALKVPESERGVYQELLEKQS